MCLYWLVHYQQFAVAYFVEYNNIQYKLMRKTCNMTWKKKSYLHWSNSNVYHYIIIQYALVVPCCWVFIQSQVATRRSVMLYFITYNVSTSFRVLSHGYIINVFLILDMYYSCYSFLIKNVSRDFSVNFVLWKVGPYWRNHSAVWWTWVIVNFVCHFIVSYSVLMLMWIISYGIEKKALYLYPDSQGMNQVS